MRPALSPRMGHPRGASDVCAPQPQCAPRAEKIHDTCAIVRAVPVSVFLNVRDHTCANTKCLRDLGEWRRLASRRARTRCVGVLPPPTRPCIAGAHRPRVTGERPTVRHTYISGERQEGALRETRSGSGLFLVVVVVALAAGYAQLPLISRLSPALLLQQARISWADCAQVPDPVPRQCMDAAQVSSPWRVPSCQDVRATFSAVRGVIVGSWTV